MRDRQKHLIRFLRQGKIGKMALNYFDPDVSSFTDSYLTKYLSFDILSGEDSRLTLKTYADLWEICGVRQKRIRSKRGCDSKSKWCNRQLTGRKESTGGWRSKEVRTFYLTAKNVGFVWSVTKKPMKGYAGRKKSEE
ncbi:unnamed protein product [Porites lobata]|uniref:Uncharacterized protein n=1 Tax=Porites lobata TaxID=104759 RepID=A0ABN8RH06_9CNID|nr:unnamed protein product [Porites lobata]